MREILRAMLSLHLFQMQDLSLQKAPSYALHLFPIVHFWRFLWPPEAAKDPNAKGRCYKGPSAKNHHGESHLYFL